MQPSRGRCAPELCRSLAATCAGAAPGWDLLGRLRMQRPRTSNRLEPQLMSNASKINSALCCRTQAHAQLFVPCEASHKPSPDSLDFFCQCISLHASVPVLMHVLDLYSQPAAGSDLLRSQKQNWRLPARRKLGVHCAQADSDQSLGIDRRAAAGGEYATRQAQPQHAPANWQAVLKGPMPWPCKRLRPSALLHRAAGEPGSGCPSARCQAGHQA